MIVDFAVAPVGAGESLSAHFAKVLEIIESCGLSP